MNAIKGIPPDERAKEGKPAKPGRNAAKDEARATVANACGREIVKLCKGSTKETSKSIPCLMAARGVSRNCIQAMDDAGYR